VYRENHTTIDIKYATPFKKNDTVRYSKKRFKLWSKKEKFTSIFEGSLTFLVNNQIIKEVGTFFVLIFYKFEIVSAIMITTIVHLVPLKNILIDKDFYKEKHGKSLENTFHIFG